MFSQGDQLEQARIAEELGKVFDVYVPQEDGIEVARVMDLLDNPALHGTVTFNVALGAKFVEWVSRAVFALDVYQVMDRCACVVLNVDGRVPDEGAVVE